MLRRGGRAGVVVDQGAVPKLLENLMQQDLQLTLKKWYVLPERLTGNKRERASLAYGIRTDFLGAPRFQMELKLDDGFQSYYTQVVDYYVKVFFREVEDLLRWKSCDMGGLPPAYKQEAISLWNKCPKYDTGLVKSPTKKFLDHVVFGAIPDDEHTLSHLLSYPTNYNLERWLEMRIPFLGASFKSDMNLFEVRLDRS